MSIVNEFIPKFYLKEPLSREEFALILPKNEEPAIVLTFEDIIALEENLLPQEGEISHQGFSAVKQTSHQQFSELYSIATEQTQINQNTQKPVSLFEYATKNLRIILAQQKIAEDENEFLQKLSRSSTLTLTEKAQGKILHPALLKHHYEIAGLLLKEGYTDPHQEIPQRAKALFGMMLGDLTDKISDYFKDATGATLKKIEHILETMEVFADHSGNVCYIPELTSTLAETTYCPLSLILRVYASLSPDETLMSKLTQTANYLAKIDTSENAYLQAKHLLHMFPTGKTYDFTVSEDKTIHFQSENNYGLFTTKFAYQSLADFTESLKTSNENPLMIDVFSKVASTFCEAASTCEKRLLLETPETLQQLYDNDATVLLPSGFVGHFFDIAVSKAQQLYLHANSGEKTLLSNSTGDTFRHLDDPSAIDFMFFYEVLNNTHKGFENGLLQRYNISEPLEHIERTPQKFSNCSWQSHCDAVEGLLYIELSKLNLEQETAKELAKSYYQEWDKFHANYVVEGYLNNNPSLPAQAFIDILHELKKESHSLSEHYENCIKKALASSEFVQTYETLQETIIHENTPEVRVETSSLAEQGTMDNVMLPLTPLCVLEIMPEQILVS